MIDRLLDCIRLGDAWLNASVVLGIGLVLLLAGAELFVMASVRIANRLRLPRITVGLTLVAIGTSLPELGASLVAVLEAGPEGSALALGNALGSNASNLGLLLGMAALLRPVATGPTRHWRHLLAMTVSAAGFAALAYTGGKITWLAGLIALGLFLAYNWLLFRAPVVAYPGTEELTDEKPRGSLIGDAWWFLLGGGLVWIGSEVLVKGAMSLATHLGVSAGVIGTGVVAVGTSLPELAVCFSAGRRGEGAILLGNLIGSNVANLLLVLGVVALVRPLALDEDALLLYTPAMLLFTVVAALMVAFGTRVSRREGLLLLVLYGVFQVMVWTR